MLPLTKEQPALQDGVGGNAKRLEWVPIQLARASENACIYRCSDVSEVACISRRSNVSGNACISRRSIHTLAADRLKKEVQFLVDVAVGVLPDKPQQAPLIMVSRRAWSPGGYRALRLLGKTLDLAWERAFVRSFTFKNKSSITKSILSTSPLPVERWLEVLLQQLCTPLDSSGWRWRHLERGKEPWQFWSRHKP